MATTMKAKLGEIFQIKVESNPSTGYIWAAVFDRTFLELVGDKFISRSNAIGSGGVTEFSFLPLKEGRTNVILKLRRPWESEATETREFALEIF